MEIHEQVVASIGPLPPEQTESEKALANEVSVIEQRAMSIVIHSAEDFEQAGEFGRQLKQQSAMVKEFFAPMKDAAHQAHQQICAREKAMLAPLVSAEKTLKTAMGNYQLEMERIRREKEEEIRRAAKAEADRKLAEASALEDKGDVAGAEAVLAGAAMLDQAGSNFRLETEKAKAAGIGSTMDWEIVSVDESKVPTHFNGAEIRPVDVSAVLKLVRASKGNISIPGIEFKETVKISIRR